MNDKLREAFDQVQAESELKTKTKSFVFQKTNGYAKAGAAGYRRLATAFACAALFLLGGYWLYFIPTVEISIDINPSIEIGVNRFDRVISFKGYNDDGRNLVNSFDVKFMDYSDAINQIIESEKISDLLAGDEIMTIAVVGADGAQCEEVLYNMQHCANGKTNTYCYYARRKDVEEAHGMGLSYGKYTAFLQLRALKPSITVQQVQNMTMREIRDLMESLSGGQEGWEPQGFAGQNYGHRGTGGRHNRRKG